MKTVLRLALIAFLMVAAGPVGWADIRLSLPASECTLELEGYYDYIEAYPTKRLRFKGCLTLEGDPAKEFYRNPVGSSGSALELEHYIVDDSLIYFWIYPDAGETAFDETRWNALIQAALEELPKRFSGELEEPFKDEANSGPPILGYASMQCRLSVLDEQTRVRFEHRFLLVPAVREGKVLLTCLLSREDQFSYMNGLFDRFVRSLYLASE
jgi:hypothetical protein